MTRANSLFRQLMQKFAYMPPKAIPSTIPTALPQQGVPPQAQGNTAPRPMPGSPHIAGSGVPQTGLPAARVTATPLPGAPGGVASNPIDTHGGLGPDGTVDGNHAAGVQKGFEIG